MWLFTCRRLPCSCPFPTRLRWPSLRCWTPASTVFCADYGLQCGCFMDAFWTPSCRSTSERRGFSSHLALIRLYSIVFVLACFSSLSPVTDSDKLTKAHETKKTQDNVEGANILTNATLLMGHGALSSQSEMFPFFGLKLCHSLNQLSHPSDWSKRFHFQL